MYYCFFVPHIARIEAAKPVNRIFTIDSGTNHKSKALQNDKQRLQLKGFLYNIFTLSGILSTSIKKKANMAAVAGMIQII
jgi:hypothetical protein